MSEPFSTSKRAEASSSRRAQYMRGVMPSSRHTNLVFCSVPHQPQSHLSSSQSHLSSSQSHKPSILGFTLGILLMSGPNFDIISLSSSIREFFHSVFPQPIV